MSVQLELRCKAEPIMEIANNTAESQQIHPHQPHANNNVTADADNHGI